MFYQGFLFSPRCRRSSEATSGFCDALLSSLGDAGARIYFSSSRREAHSKINRVLVSLARGGNSCPANQWHHAYQTVSNARVGRAGRLSDGCGDPSASCVIDLSTPSLPHQKSHPSADYYLFCFPPLPPE